MAGAEQWKTNLVAVKEAMKRSPGYDVAPYWGMTFSQQFAHEARRRRGLDDQTWRLWAAWSYEQAIDKEEPMPDIDWRV